MEFKLELKEGTLRLFLPSANSGKFRIKQRESQFDYGATFKAQEMPFDDSVYLEWMIGYDLEINSEEFLSGKKTTELTSIKFTSLKGVEKHPYELSELLFKAVGIGLIQVSEIESLSAEIEGYNSFLDEKPITVGKCSSVSINDMDFKEACTMLPTLFMTNTPDGTQIDVFNRQQQKALSFQPMINFCIPLSAFSNASSFRGRPSVRGEKLIYVMNKSNVANIMLLVKVFAMASKRHHHDITEILKLLIQLAEK
jgi:hypothetical protein